MRIIGHGIDLVKVSRIAQMRADHGDRFLMRCFTEGEQAYASDHRRRDEHLAARFAAKEAALKALGSGLADGIAWSDVEVVRTPSGKPELRVTGRAQEIATSLGITGWFLSMTHTDTDAMASVIAVGDVR